jgi:hypothetical protein
VLLVGVCAEHLVDGLRAVELRVVRSVHAAAKRHSMKKPKGHNEFFAFGEV